MQLCSVARSKACLCVTEIAYSAKLVHFILRFSEQHILYLNFPFEIMVSNLVLDFTKYYCLCDLAIIGIKILLLKKWIIFLLTGCISFSHKLQYTVMETVQLIKNLQAGKAHQWKQGRNHGLCGFCFWILFLNPHINNVNRGMPVLKSVQPKPRSNFVIGS